MIHPDITSLKAGDRIVDPVHKRTGELWNRSKGMALNVTWHNETTQQWAFVKDRKNMLFQRS